MNWFNKNWFKITVLVVIIIFGMFFAYYTQIKPSNARKECAQVARENYSDSDDFSYNGFITVLNTCLQEKGVKPQINPPGK